ncbi:MAG: phospholipase D-like domain-containing protein [Anaerolineae bacterium]|nr:phospholipase D-like domain-containing protein [Anaerolineae bacterium]
MTKGGRGFGFKELLLSLFMMVVAWATKECIAPSTPGGNTSGPGGTIRIVFTTPRYPDSALDHRGGLDEELIAAIDAAQERVDVAIYNLDLASVAHALIRADQRGVTVRLLTESDYADAAGASALRGAGIPVVTDGQAPFMHNKFVVIDRHTVWTGSWNVSDSETYRNNNNVVIVRSEELARNFSVEFDEMFEDGRFGATSPDTVPHPELTIDGVRVETFFESEGNVRSRIIELINDAETSLHFLAYTFTDDGIANAIIDRHRDGLDVSGVIEGRNTEDPGSDFSAFVGAGVPVLKDGNPYLMHHKVIIVDGDIVITGSYNFSASAANANDENVLILRSPDVAAAYEQEYEVISRLASEAVGSGN